jgi:hypothetical protein
MATVNYPARAGRVFLYRGYFFAVDVAVPDFEPVDFPVEDPVFVPGVPLDALHSSLEALAEEEVFFEELVPGAVLFPLLVEVEVEPPDAGAFRSCTHSATLAISPSGRAPEGGITTVLSVAFMVRKTSSETFLTLA